MVPHIVRCLLRAVRSSTPCSVFRSSSEPLDCCSTETQLRTRHGISIWTTSDSSISGWQSLSIVRIHTAKPQNQSERETRPWPLNEVDQRSRYLVASLQIIPLFLPAPSHSSRLTTRQHRLPPNRKLF